jgi:hypothetical protein
VSTAVPHRSPYADRLRDLKISVGSEAPSRGQAGEEIDTVTAVCKHAKGTLAEYQYTFVCDSPVEGRFLNIQPVPGADILTLCEVEVYAEPGVFTYSPLVLMTRSPRENRDHVEMKFLVLY